MIYAFSDNSSWNRVFTRAIEIRASSPITDRECAKCGSASQMPIGGFDVVVEGGTKYPDVLGCGFYPFLVLSRKAIDALRIHAVDAFDSFPVRVVEVRSKKLKAVQPPDYFRIEITANVEIDLNASGITIEKYCSGCGSLEARPVIPQRFELVAGSWDDNVLFRNKKYFPRIYFCSDDLLTIASQFQLSNFRFTRIDHPFDPAERGVPYLVSGK